MSELEAELTQIARATAMKLYCEQHVMLWPFGHFDAGAPISIELSGEVIEGIQVEPDQTIAGELVNSRAAEVLVSSASHRDKMIGRSIILAANCNIMTPIGISVSTTARHCVSPRATMAYYHPEDVSPDSLYGFPDHYEQVAGRYMRVCVGDIEFFNVANFVQRTLG